MLFEGAVSLGRHRALPVCVSTEARRLGVRGPSGSGKSSLLRAIAGHAPLGIVRIDGVELERHGYRVPPWARQIGWTPQEPLLPPHVRVHHLLAWADPEVDPRPVAELLGIGPLLGRRPRHLSGGERQRVAIGRALLAARRCLLLDEPFSALDGPLRDRVVGAVDDWARDRDLPLVLVSHDPQDLSRIADEVVDLGTPGLRPEHGVGSSPG